MITLYKLQIVIAAILLKYLKSIVSIENICKFNKDIFSLSEMVHVSNSLRQFPINYSDISSFYLSLSFPLSSKTWLAQSESSAIRKRL